MHMHAVVEPIEQSISDSLDASVWVVVLPADAGVSVTHPLFQLYRKHFYIISSNSTLHVVHVSWSLGQLGGINNCRSTHHQL